MPETKFIFFGTPEFAAIVLKKLFDGGFAPSAVVCNPDRPVGRKKIVTPPPTKQLIANRKAQSTVFQPEDLKSISLNLKSLNPDFAVVAAYAKIIPKEILDIPRLGTIGVHPSLLPKYRGASPIQSAILAGEEKTGVTLYLLDDKMDHGPILATREFSILNFQFSILFRKLAELGGDLLVETLPKFLAGQIEPRPQDESDATYAKKFKTEDGYIEPAGLKKALEEGGEIASIIERKIRAFSPEPGTWTTENERRKKLLEAELTPDNKLKLKKIQFEGEKPKELR